ncbi:uroporphyrinogen decarboxylase family protein [uncultured Paludibaculum sp.]|uniref:uroporphyrinogen decarboxylase family protein n=1 Tax=uncultured Paludibaculum sp. TaxID=1765020 RepID=UPI002AAABDFC|nr:uroporphyrinogen decarboxylase family protein [uncultured Paludibaculum sp.]
MHRRKFLGLAPLGAGALIAGGRGFAAPSAGPANKRERMLQWLAGKPDTHYTPAAFFLHFGPNFKTGSAAAQRHLEFFRATDMDFVKIQFEQTYDRQPNLNTPADWSKLKLQKLDFYEAQLQTVRDLVKAAKKDALIVMTLYSPFMCAGHCATAPVLRRHLEENPEAVKRGLEILTESQMLFVRACVQAGVDGFYMSTQGSETKQFANPKIFLNYVKPFDLVAMKEVSAKCPFNILHVCDYNAPYAGYDATLDYPGQVVNCNPKLTDKQLPLPEIARMFKRPYMGGLDRHGLLASGAPQAIDTEVKRVIQSAPRQFILGADCTVAAETDWKRLRQIITLAHQTGHPS